MASKLETRIATQRYHGISSRDWFRLSDEEQAALIAEAQGAPKPEPLKLSSMNRRQY